MCSRVGRQVVGVGPPVALCLAVATISDLTREREKEDFESVRTLGIAF
jgi:hypothetical protein